MELSEVRQPTKKCSFFDGCTSYKAESIAIHELSQFHRDAVMHMEERNKPITSSQAGKAKQALQKDVMGKLDKLFRIVHALAYNNRPLNDYIWQVSLMEAGPNGFRLGQQYVNYSAAYEFLKYICKDAFSVVRKHITDAPFISIMGDDSTDVASIEQSM